MRDANTRHGCGRVPRRQRGRRARFAGALRLHLRRAASPPRRRGQLADAEIEALIAERTAAKKARDFARADQIREELLEQGIILEDTKSGVRWKKEIRDA